MILTLDDGSNENYYPERVVKELNINVKNTPFKGYFWRRIRRNNSYCSKVINNYQKTAI